jgi:hypothetical protein
MTSPITLDPRFMGYLFQPWTDSWGLRGDPYLWEEMLDTLAKEPMPASVTQLIALLERTFEQLVGSPFNIAKESVFVEKYNHGGMSSGHVCIEFWRERIFPELQGRYFTLRSIASPSNSIPNTSIAKPCRFEFYPEGCRYGINCRFRHTFPARTSPTSTGGTSTYQSTTALLTQGITYSSNGMMGGTNLYGHNNMEMTTRLPKPTVCIHFLRGKCTFGSACRFSHF